MWTGRRHAWKGGSPAPPPWPRVLQCHWRKPPSVLAAAPAPFQVQACVPGQHMMKPITGVRPRCRGRTSTWKVARIVQTALAWRPAHDESGGGSVRVPAPTAAPTTPVSGVRWLHWPSGAGMGRTLVASSPSMAFSSSVVRVSSAAAASTSCSSLRCPTSKEKGTNPGGNINPGARKGGIGNGGNAAPGSCPVPAAASVGTDAWGGGQGTPIGGGQGAPIGGGNSGGAPGGAPGGRKKGWL